MKNVKLQKIDPKLDRKLISRVGEKIYHSDGVESLIIKVNFKDGSTIGYRRSENKDAFERAVEEGDEDE